MSNIRDIARLVGVSPASVSLYLNNPETTRVGPATKKRIDDAVIELNYHKNIFASTLSLQRSQIIGIIIPSSMPLFSNEFTNSLLTGLQLRFSEQGYSMLFFPSDAHNPVQIVEQQVQRSVGCDGYVLFSAGFCTFENLKQNITTLQSTNKPFVTLNIPEMDEARLQVLIEDLDRCTGTRHLLEAGHRKIGLMLGRKGGMHADKILENHRQYLISHHLELDETTVVYGDYNATTAYHVALGLFERHQDLTGLNCMSDIMAIAALQAARDVGIDVPRDLSIIGRNNSLHATLSTPTITTIDLHTEEAGQQAAQLLLDAMAGKAESRKLAIKSTFVQRHTVNIIS